MKFLTAFFILVFGSYQPVHANDQPCADINGDGQVNVADFFNSYRTIRPADAVCGEQAICIYTKQAAYCDGQGDGVGVSVLDALSVKDKTLWVFA